MRKLPSPTPTGTEVEHRELFSGNLYAGKGESILLDITSPEVFPWLYRMSPMFETYEILSLKISFATGQSLEASGRIYMSFDYDPADKPPREKAVIANAQGAKSCNVRENMSITFDRRRMKDIHKYTATGSDASRFTSLGRFNYIIDSSATGSMGDFYIDYKVRFKTPQVVDSATPEYCFMRPTNVELTLPAGSSQWFRRSSFEGTKVEAHPMGDGWSLQTPISGTYSLVFSGTGNDGIAYPTVEGLNGVELLVDNVSASTAAAKQARYLAYFPERTTPIRETLVGEPAIRIAGGSGTLTAFLLNMVLSSRLRTFGDGHSGYNIFGETPL